MTTDTAKQKEPSPISFRLPPELHGQLARLAFKNDRSVSAEIRRAVVAYIEREGT